MNKKHELRLFIVQRYDGPIVEVSITSLHLQKARENHGG